jgi:maltose alpha-D-glucosyltransferase/alpha-amylase
VRAGQVADLWWKTATIYCLDVETFADGNGDGVGDFRGLGERVDYLDRLGVTCIWLMPFYPSRNVDDGYDITDYYSVDPRLGTMGDVVEFLRTAQNRGIRVIADLVVNHTSDQHPWFKQSRRSRDNPYRDWYVWRDTPPKDGPGVKDVVFPGQQKGVWTKDAKTGQYYLHRFLDSQPDLNVTNPEVRDEIARIIGFWMHQGLSGFRVDAVPFLLDTAGALEAADLPQPHDFLRDLRTFMGRRQAGSILLGEVNLPRKDTLAYFGDETADELTMCFDFVGMQAMYLALARKDAAPLARALRDRPEAPQDGQWANFVRNHDELTLDKLTDEEREEVFAAFGPDPGMQLYGRGLRRRLPPMLDGDEQRIRMVYSLLFSLPGTPVLFYGEEIGMGENLDVEGRRAVRTPMQWSATKNGGFSTAAPRRLPAAPPSGGYSPEHVSVDAQIDRPASLLSWMTFLSRRYRECPEFGWGSHRVVPTDDDRVLAHVAFTPSGLALAVHNFSDEAAMVVADLGAALDGLDTQPPEQLRDLLTTGPDETPVVVEDGKVMLGVERYGCRWLR